MLVDNPFLHQLSLWTPVKIDLNICITAFFNTNSLLWSSLWLKMLWGDPGGHQEPMSVPLIDLLLMMNQTLRIEKVTTCCFLEVECTVCQIYQGGILASSKLIFLSWSFNQPICSWYLPFLNISSALCLLKEQHIPWSVGVIENRLEQLILWPFHMHSFIMPEKIILYSLHWIPTWRQNCYFEVWIFICSVTNSDNNQVKSKHKFILIYHCFHFP